MMKAGFTNSEDWIEMPRILTQRRAPLTSCPTKRVAASIRMPTPSATKATRLTPRGEKNEQPISIAIDGSMKRAWRLMKKNVSGGDDTRCPSTMVLITPALMRSATEGLAANDMTSPRTINVMKPATR